MFAETTNDNQQFFNDKLPWTDAVDASSAFHSEAYDISRPSQMEITQPSPGFKDNLALAHFVSENFQSMDLNSDLALDREELTIVANDKTRNADELSAAEQLSQNYDQILSLSRKTADEDILDTISTESARNRYSEIFASDEVENGISQKDLHAFEMLSSSSGLEELTNGIKEQEAQRLRDHMNLAGGGTAAAAIFFEMMMKSNGDVRKGLLFMAGTLLSNEVIYHYKDAWNNYFNSGVKGLTEQYAIEKERLGQPT